MIKGIPVKLYERTASGTDTFGHPIYTEAPVTVEDVLVAPASTTEVLDMFKYYRKKSSLQYRNSKRRYAYLARLQSGFFWCVMAGNWLPSTGN